MFITLCLLYLAACSRHDEVFYSDIDGHVHIMAEPNDSHICRSIIPCWSETIPLRDSLGLVVPAGSHPNSPFGVPAGTLTIGAIPTTLEFNIALGTHWLIDSIQIQLASGINTLCNVPTTTIRFAPAVRDGIFQLPLIQGTPNVAKIVLYVYKLNQNLAVKVYEGKVYAYDVMAQLSRTNRYLSIPFTGCPSTQLSGQNSTN